MLRDTRLQRGLAAADDARTEWQNVLDESPGDPYDRNALSLAIRDLNRAISRVQCLTAVQVPNA